MISVNFVFKKIIHGNLAVYWALIRKKGEKEMAKKAKRMCKWSEKDLEEKFDKFTAIVSNPKFLCKKCLRVADKKKWLHKPAPLK